MQKFYELNFTRLVPTYSLKTVSSLHLSGEYYLLAMCAVALSNDAGNYAIIYCQ